jgi:hypothetical protein
MGMRINPMWPCAQAQAIAAEKAEAQQLPAQAQHWRGRNVQISLYIHSKLPARSTLVVH